MENPGLWKKICVQAFSRKNTEFHALIMVLIQTLLLIEALSEEISPRSVSKIEICSFAYMMVNYQKYAQEKI